MIAPDRHVVLVGLMGVGKSTIGRMLADRLHRPLLDTDQLIESATGRTVRQIFADDGEAAFRECETQALLGALASETPAVIAAAGGVVLSAENRAALEASGAKVVWLSATPELLAQRTHRGVHRPLLDADRLGTLQRMANEREAMYREVADVIVSVDHRSVSDVVEAVLR